MKKIFIIIAVLVVVGIGVYYIIGKKSVQQPLTTPILTPAASVSNTPEPTAVSSATVDIRNFSFNPSALTIKKGTKVTWVNNDIVSHTVTSDSGNLLNSSTLSPGQSFSFTFTDLGTINYHCGIHTTMRGGVIVTN